MFHIATTSLALFMQAAPVSDPSQHWLAQFTANLSNLTTQNGGALTQFGLVELSFVSLMVLVGMVVNWQTSTMFLSLRRHPSMPVILFNL